MTSEPAPSFEQLEEEYNQALSFLTDALYDFVPRAISDTFEYARNNELCVAITSVLFVVIGFHFVRRLFDVFSSSR